MTQDDTLSPATARALAVGVLVLGSTCAVVNAWLFSLGLERLEPDAQARLPLQLAGWLMVSVEHIGLGLAALLPASMTALKRRLTTLAILLAVLEVAGLYTAQAALEHVNRAASVSHQTRAADLRAAIDSRRATVDQLRANGSQQSSSSNGWRQQLGANALRDALAAEQQIVALEAELATLQGNSRPTLSDTLGPQGAALMAAARSALIAAMGLVLLSAAGSLWAYARRTPAAQPAARVEKASLASAPEKPVAPAATFHQPSAVHKLRDWIPWRRRGPPGNRSARQPAALDSPPPRERNL